jgi:ArsR family transcriptional regulator, arsenate/arsenite/antimonite-responsive transcriptional repressor
MPISSTHTTSSDLIIAGFHALSEPLRVKVIQLVSDRELCVCDLCDILKVSQSKLSFHLKTLKEAQLVNSRQEGRWIYYSLNPSQFTLLEEFLTNFSLQTTVTPSRCCQD